MVLRSMNSRYTVILMLVRGTWEEGEAGQRGRTGGFMEMLVLWGNKDAVLIRGNANPDPNGC